MRKIALVLFLLFSGSILGLLFSNCGQNQPISESNQTSEQTDISTQLTEPFANSKMDFNWQGVERMALHQGANSFAQKIRAATKVSEILLPEGLKFIVNVDNTCPQLTTSKIFSWVDKSFQHENLRQQAYPAILPEAIFFSQLQELANQDPCIIGVSNDDLLNANSSTDPLYTSQSQLSSIEHPDFYELISQSSWGAQQNVVVAVIDSGIDYNHPDLRNNLWQNASGHYGYDFENGDTDPRDDFGHGTAVAGLIAAESGNGIGVQGVLGKNIKIMSLKVQDSEGAGSISSVVSALDYARAQGVDVINISMSGQGSNQSLRTALLNAANANIFVALAAGNSGAAITSSSPVMPAIYGAEANGLVTVGSVDSGNIFNRSSFSNYSSTYVEITAPGNQGVYFPQMNSNYTTGSGTSYSAPLVAGAAAAVISFFKTNNIPYNAGEIEALLNSTALVSGSLSQYVRNGRILHFGNLRNYLSTAYLGNQTGGMDEF